MNENEFLDWDSEVTTDDPVFEMISEGEHPFIVANFEKSRSKAGAPMAVVTLAVFEDKNTSFEVKEFLPLMKKMEWKISRFFISLGLKEKGDDHYKPEWDRIRNQSGILRIKHEEYNGKMYPKVDEFLEPTTKKKAPAKKKEEPTEEMDMPFEF